jgi:KaiC/GvpD/RAD55 family RecA-like ATPase
VIKRNEHTKNRRRREMNILKIGEEWLQKLLPEGFPYPSSTLFSGPGGTGKPLVVLAFVSSWLKSGGSVIGIPLQYPTAEFVRTAMSKIYRINLEKHHGRIISIQFDPSIDEYEEIGDNTIKANLLKPYVWDNVIKKAEDMVGKTDLGTLVFGSALNLLLFSPTYQRDIIKKLENIIKNDKSRTYLFSVSTSAFADEIRVWEEVADNLMYTRMEKPMRLFFKISKMKGVKFSREEIEVPISQEVLSEIKDVAEVTRKRIIPEIMKI